jgi:hypothetical protein
MEHYKMLKVPKGTHDRFMVYISKRHIATRHKMTVAETINELLDIAEGVNGDRKRE